MSYNVAIITPLVPADDTIAWPELKMLTAQEVLRPPVFLKVFDWQTATIYRP